MSGGRGEEVGDLDSSKGGEGRSCLEFFLPRRVGGIHISFARKLTCGGCGDRGGVGVNVNIQGEWMAGRPIHGRRSLDLGLGTILQEETAKSNEIDDDDDNDLWVFPKSDNERRDSSPAEGDAS